MSNSTNSKQKNIADILKILHLKKTATKNILAKNLNMSSGTVHNIVTELCEMGLCKESGEYISSGGRNAAVYKINGDYGAIIGAALSRTGVAVSVYDISLKNLFYEEIPSSLDDIDGCIEIICGNIQKAFNAFAGIKLLGIGVIVPGRVRTDGSVINIPDAPGWKDVPLLWHIKNKCVFIPKDTPVYVDNDNNAKALSSKWNGITNGLENYVYLTTATGVGVGVIINNELFYGGRRNGCEIGHVSIDLHGERCKCGNIGCLQLSAKSTTLLEKIQEYMAAKSVEVNDLRQAADLYKSGEYPELHGFFDENASYIALTVEYIIKIFDPDAVIFGRTWLSALPEFVKTVENKIFSRCSWLGRDTFHIILNQNETVSKAAPSCLILETLYNPYDANMIYNFAEYNNKINYLKS